MLALIRDYLRERGEASMADIALHLDADPDAVTVAERLGQDQVGQRVLDAALDLLELALELIAEEETHERGWYAGPLGWIGRDGDGEFVVALRAGVIEGAQATLFAGCGIVADSDPEREWEESSAKLQALGSALGRFEP